MLMRHLRPKTARLVRSAAVVAVLILAVLIFPSGKDTFVFLHRLDFAVLSHAGEVQELTDLRTPGAGEYVLPPEVQVMIGLLRFHRVDAFRFSPAIADKPVFAQRLTEGAYPRRVVPDAPYLVYFVGEQTPGTCRTIGAQEGVALAYCP